MFLGNKVSQFRHFIASYLIVTKFSGKPFSYLNLEIFYRIFKFDSSPSSTLSKVSSHHSLFFPFSLSAYYFHLCYFSAQTSSQSTDSVLY